VANPCGDGEEDEEVEELMTSKVKKVEKQLKIHRTLMKTYLQLKVDEEDWHGVADAAMDLRDIDSELKGLKNA
jgi:hypothetical protein